MRRFLPSFSGLYAFEAATRHMNFTRAAEDLGMTQSGVSRQIKNVEDYLGISLFERSGSRLVLTDSGRVYAQEVAAALDKLEEASIDVVRGHKADTGLLVGALPTIASRWLAPRLDSYTAQYPDGQIEITPTTSDVDFETSPIDVAVLRGDGPWSNARSYELFSEEIVVVASPSLVPLGESRDPMTFASYRLLQNAARPSGWLQWLRSAGLDYQGTIHGPRFAYTSMLINAAVSGLGLAVAPIPLIERELESGALHMPFGPPVRSGDSYYVVYPERKAHFESVKNFRDWLLRETRSRR